MHLKKTACVRETGVFRLALKLMVSDLSAFLSRVMRRSTLAQAGLLDSTTMRDICKRWIVNFSYTHSPFPGREGTKRATREKYFWRLSLASSFGELFVAAAAGESGEGRKALSSEVHKDSEGIMPLGNTLLYYAAWKRKRIPAKNPPPQFLESNIFHFSWGSLVRSLSIARDSLKGDT